ncbi:MAG: UDP-N-acetylglucosamine 1-carboxyvinyltransferase, partial [Kiritimatiellae bacterium]|nr:UDP-N-acetylglucosamine 1-carboxyvinyltransferase [Kiritimatiellia bacterium]
MSKLVIRGQRPISGVHRVTGNKNAVLPMIAASLLTAEPVTLENVPDIADVASMLEAAERLGAAVSRDKAAGTVRLCTPRVRSARIDAQLAARIRTSFLFAGPLLARVGRATLPPPGGDAIGARRLDTHFAGFRALGAKAHPTRRSLALRAERGGL